MKRINVHKLAWSVLLLASATMLANCGDDEEFPDTPPPDTGTPLKLSRVFNALTFAEPLFLTAAPGDTQRLFVVEKGGNIYSFVRTAGSPSKQLFLNLSAKLATSGEQGLLGLAFDPDYADNQYFYVYYSAIAGTDGNTRSTVVARYRTTTDPTVADPTSELKLLTIPQPAANSNHNGGWIAFGPDGKLYVSVGDGGGSGDPNNNAQNVDSLLGKILRINSDGTIPADNPYVGKSGRDEIWASGLRNPFRASFDRETGKLWIGDVGESSREEVDIGAIGANYGWRKYEGTSVYKPDDPEPASPVQPAFEYNHDNGRCAITGGYVYRGPTTAMASYKGFYFYADYCSKQVWTLSGNPLVSTLIGTLPTQPTSFGEDSDGELYLTGSDGGLYKIEPQ